MRFICPSLSTQSMMTALNRHRCTHCTVFVTSLKMYFVGAFFSFLLLGKKYFSNAHNIVVWWWTRTPKGEFKSHQFDMHTLHMKIIILIIPYENKPISASIRSNEWCAFHRKIPNKFDSFFCDEFQAIYGWRISLWNHFMHSKMVSNCLLCTMTHCRKQEITIAKWYA